MLTLGFIYSPLFLLELIITSGFWVLGLGRWLLFLCNSFICVILFLYNSSLKISSRTVIKILNNMSGFFVRDICPRTHCLPTPIWTCRLSLLYSYDVRTSIHYHPRNYFYLQDSVLLFLLLRTHIFFPLDLLPSFIWTHFQKLPEKKEYVGV